MFIQDIWLSGYAFWRGQYSVRNQRYKEMASALSKRKIEVAKECGRDYILQNMVIWGVNEDPFVYERKIQKRRPLNLDDILDLKSSKMALNKEFPYVSHEIDPLIIIDEICNGKFPPNFDNICEDMKLPVVFRSKAVYYRACDRHGLEILAIDSDAEIFTIVSEVKRCIEFIKEKKDLSIINKEDVVLRSGDVGLLKDELKLSGSAYRVNSDESRALGLILFEYAENNDCSDAQTIRSIRKELTEHGPKNFGKADSSDRQFQRWLTNTRKCIDAAEVLEI